MSNSWFRFRRFTVHQERCAMKVSTDACIQGAWTPIETSVRRALDIGAGTGLLSLMLAQRSPTLQIDAVESDPDAAAQAMENFAGSPFSDRITAHHADAITWTAGSRYDLIICNPPFFSNSLQGPDHARNAARHADTIHPESLVNLLLSRLPDHGYASLMLPPFEHGRFTELAANAALYLQRMLQVKDREGSRITRMIGIYSRHARSLPAPEQLVIKNEDGGYTTGFRELLAPFYWHL